MSEGTTTWEPWMDKLLDLFRHVYTTSLNHPVEMGAPQPVAMLDARRMWSVAEPFVRKEIEKAKNNPVSMEVLKRRYPQVFE